jgi:hypothetical protein
MEDSSNLDGELFLAAWALPPLLVGKPENITDLTSCCAVDFAIGPAHGRDFIDANLLIAKVLNRVYECGGYFMTPPPKLVKYIVTRAFASVSAIYRGGEWELSTLGRFGACLRALSTA